MCYAYYKDRAAQKDGAESGVTMDREAGKPAVEAVTMRHEVEEKAYRGFLDRIRQLLAAQKQKPTEPTSV